MNNCELTAERINELAAQMPEEARLIFLRVLQKDVNNQAYEYIKKWAENYEIDNPIDDLLAPIIARIISKIGSGVENFMQENKINNMGEVTSFMGRQFVGIAIENIKKVTSELENVIKNTANSDDAQSSVTIN